MTKVCIVGDMYYTDLSIGGGPIYPPSGGGQPPGIWGGPPSYVDIGGPGAQPGPSHPWVPPRPGQPPGIWGGRPPNYPDIGGPGPQPHPDQGLPGPQPHPDHGLPGQPPGFWGGTPPVYIDIGPPGQQPPQPPDDPSKIEWHTGWTQTEGWVTVGIVKPERPIPTPST
jgi:hypothetical protein